MTARWVVRREPASSASWPPCRPGAGQLSWQNERTGRIRWQRAHLRVTGQQRCYLVELGGELASTVSLGTR